MGSGLYTFHSSPRGLGIFDCFTGVFGGGVLMNESGVWQTLKNGMVGKWHVSRIESSAGNGIPDLTFGISAKQGWVELKYIPEWPVREGTKLKLPLRPEQKHWIKARGSLSGDVWVFVRVMDTFFLLSWFKALDAAEEGWTGREWLTKSNLWWEKRVDFGELLDALKGGC